jgi:hypothetical protein
MECLKCGEDCELSNHNFFCSDECASTFWDDYDGMTKERRKQLWNHVLESACHSALEHLKKAFNVSKRQTTIECGCNDLMARVREGITTRR